MITKQQALEFLYELSKGHDILINLSQGNIEMDSIHNISREDDNEDFKFYVEDENNVSLENLVTKFIKENINTKLFKELNFPIPIDVDMLEVGQTYKVHVQTDWDHSYFTSKFLGFDEEDNYVLKFENNKPITKYDIREMYKEKGE